MRHHKPYIILGAFLITILAVPAGVVWPSVKTINETATAIYEEYEFLEDRHQRGQDIQRAREELGKIATEIEALRNVALEPEGELLFITDIEALAEERQVAERLSIRLDEAQILGSVRHIPFELTITGNYQNVLRYVIELPTLALVTQINTVTFATITPRGQTPTANNQQTQARLSGFVYQHTQVLNEGAENTL